MNGGQFYIFADWWTANPALKQDDEIAVLYWSRLMSGQSMLKYNDGRSVECWSRVMEGQSNVDAKLNIILIRMGQRDDFAVT